jgi:hypothetical protein
MKQRTVSTAPPGWQVAVEVDSRLEGDLAARLLAAGDIEATVIERGSNDFAVFVAAEQREQARRILDLT